MHIRISLGTKFQFKLISLIFLNKICLKRDFLVEKRKIALVRASLLLLINFSARCRQTQRYFNVSSSSHRDNNYKLLVTFQQVDVYLMNPSKLMN